MRLFRGEQVSALRGFAFSAVMLVTLTANIFGDWRFSVEAGDAPLPGSNSGLRQRESAVYLLGFRSVGRLDAGFTGRATLRAARTGGAISHCICPDFRI